jgi:hypothetical protein
MWTRKNRACYDRSKLRYPSDLTDDEWGLVEPLIAPARLAVRVWVKRRNTRREQMFSALPPKADSSRASRATSITDGSSVSRERKLKESTPRFARDRPQLPAVGFDDRAADR